MCKKNSKILLGILIVLICFCSWHIIKWKIFQNQLKGKIVSGSMIWDPRYPTSEFHSRIPFPQRAAGIRISLHRGISVSSPSWSHDGKKIAFENYDGGTATGTSNGLLIVNIDGHNIPGRKLVTVDINKDKLQTLLSMKNVYYPSWSPDGTKIAFLVNPEVIHDEEGLPYYGLRYLYVVSVDNPVPRRVINEGCSIGIPSWSPDSKRILFASPSSDSGPGDIYIVNENGTDLRQIGNGLNPSWSPDGTRIAFLYQNNIHIMDSNGKNIRLLVRNCSLGYNHTSQIAWSPDGRFIMYCVPARSIVPISVYKTVVVSTRYGWWRTWISYGSYMDSISWIK